MRRKLINCTKPAFISTMLLVAFCTFGVKSEAQFSLTGQLRTRSEFRDGQGAPLPEGASPAFFTSQRTRLNFLFNTYRLKFGASVQDVRVWGQDVSTINRTTTQDNNGFMLHEAWAEILLTDTVVKNKTVSLKIGRQELIYDDQRLLGNLDWLQQGRRHDAAVLKYENSAWRFHLGGAFNQNKENSTGTVYNSTPAGNYASSTNGGAMYKSMEFAYAGKKLKNGSASFLFFADQFSKYYTDTVNHTGVKVFQTGTWSRATTGFYVNNGFGRLDVTAGAYYQFGKNATGQKLSAAMFNLLAQYSFGKFSAGPGFDYTSGGGGSTVSHVFDPLYGTPHKFWGLMDYFYAASPFGRGGLMDYHIKSRLKASDKFLVSADIHHFTSASRITEASNAGRQKSYGQEVDIVTSYNITKQITLEAGYGHFFTTALLSSSAVKNIPDARSGGNWAYVMINIKPEFLFK